MVLALCKLPRDPTRRACWIDLNYSPHCMIFDLLTNGHWDLSSRIHLIKRVFVALFLKNRSSHFSEILYDVRLQKFSKNFPSTFLRKFPDLAILAKKCPNTNVFGIFWNLALEIPNICTKYSLWSWIKWLFHFVWGNWPFLAKIDPNLAKMTQNGGFFVRRMFIRNNLEFSPRPFFRP